VSRPARSEQERSDAPGLRELPAWDVVLRSERIVFSAEPSSPATEELMEKSQSPSSIALLLSGSTRSSKPTKYSISRNRT